VEGREEVAFEGPTSLGEGGVEAIPDGLPGRGGGDGGTGGGHRPGEGGGEPDHLPDDLGGTGPTAGGEPDGAGQPVGEDEAEVAGSGWRPPGRVDVEAGRLGLLPGGGVATTTSTEFHASYYS
jgi:hypothetical protein